MLVEYLLPQRQDVISAGNDRGYHVGKSVYQSLLLLLMVIMMHMRATKATRCWEIRYRAIQLIYRKIKRSSFPFLWYSCCSVSDGSL